MVYKNQNTVYILLGNMIAH